MLNFVLVWFETTLTFNRCVSIGLSRTATSKLFSKHMSLSFVYWFVLWFFSYLQEFYCTRSKFSFSRQSQLRPSVSSSRKCQKRSVLVFFLFDSYSICDYSVDIFYVQNHYLRSFVIVKIVFPKLDIADWIQDFLKFRRVKMNKLFMIK